MSGIVGVHDAMTGYLLGLVGVHVKYGKGTYQAWRWYKLPWWGYMSGMLVVHARYMSCICHLILAIGWVFILYIFTWTLHVVWYGFLEVQWLGPKSKQPMQTW